MLDVPPGEAHAAELVPRVAPARRRAAGRTGRRWDVALVLIAIVGLAALPRLADLGANPPEFFEDELSGLVSAWSVATTGEDIGPTALPFLTTRLELKPPLYFALTVPAHAVLGPGVLAARLPAVGLGLLTVALTAWLAVVLGRTLQEAIAAAAVVGVLPWAIHYSRVGWEPAAWLPIVVIGLGLLWIGLERHRPLAVVSASAVLALGWYAYRPAMLMDVLLAAVVVGLQARSIDRRDLVGLVLGGLVAVAMVIPIAQHSGHPLFGHRTAQLFVFGDGPLSTSLGRFLAAYVAQWDPIALVGERAAVNRITPGPLLLPWMLPVFVVGVARLLQRRSRGDLLVLALLVLGPLPAALAQDAIQPHAARGLVAMPGFAIATGVGVVAAIEKIARRTGPVDRRRLVFAALAALIAIETAGWAGWYLGTYPARSATSWGYGGGAALELAGRYLADGGTLCVTKPAISVLTLAHRLAYYLPGRDLKVEERIDRAPCRQRGAVLVTSADRSEPAGAARVAEIADPVGRPIYRVWVVGAPGEPVQQPPPRPVTPAS